VRASHSEAYDCLKIVSQHESVIVRSPKALPKKLRNQPNFCCDSGDCGEPLSVAAALPIRDRLNGEGCWRRTLSSSGDKTMFGVVVSRLVKMFKPNLAAGVGDP
jgi:hypothetical protein